MFRSEVVLLRPLSRCNIRLIPYKFVSFCEWRPHSRCGVRGIGCESGGPHCYAWWGRVGLKARKCEKSKLLLRVHFDEKPLPFYILICFMINCWTVVLTGRSDGYTRSSCARRLNFSSMRQLIPCSGAPRCLAHLQWGFILRWLQMKHCYAEAPHGSLAY